MVNENARLTVKVRLPFYLYFTAE